MESLGAGVKGYIAKTRFGRYTGVVQVAAFLAAALCQAILPSLWSMISPVIGSLTGTFLLLSMIENLPGLFMVASDQ
jgi:hypothetical protein